MNLRKLALPSIPQGKKGAPCWEVWGKRGHRRERTREREDTGERGRRRERTQERKELAASFQSRLTLCMVSNRTVPVFSV